MPGLKEWKVTYKSAEARHVYVTADSEEGAKSIAQDIPVKDWIDDTDERNSEEYEAVEDE